MFNPLVNSLNDLTNTQVDEKLQELQRKYFQTQNPQLKVQIQNLLEMYKIEKETRTAKELMKTQESDNNNLDGLININ